MSKSSWRQNIIFSLLLLMIGNFLPCPNLTSGLTAKQALADKSYHGDSCVEMQQGSKKLSVAGSHGQKVADCCLEKNIPSSLIAVNSSLAAPLIGNIVVVYPTTDKEIFNKTSYISPPPRLNGSAQINKKE